MQFGIMVITADNRIGGWDYVHFPQILVGKTWIYFFLSSAMGKIVRLNFLDLLKGHSMSKHQQKIKICTQWHQISWNLAQMFPFMS